MSELRTDTEAGNEEEENLDEFEEHAREYQQAEQGEPDAETEGEGAEAESDDTDEQEEPDLSAEASAKAEEKEEEKQTVPLGTFLDEKRARKETQTELQSLREELKALKDQLTPKEPDPDPEEDPFGYLSKGQKSLEEKIEQIGTKFEESSQQAQAGQLQQQVARMENEFAEKTPDYWDAAEHIKNRRLEDYKLMGVDEDKAWEALNQEAATIVGNALREGKNPAEVIYSFAQRYGYTPPAAEPAEGEPKKPNGDAEKSLKSFAKKKEQAQTLSGVGGESGKDELDLPDINSMDDEEFDKLFLGKDGDKRLKQLMQ